MNVKLRVMLYAHKDQVYIPILGISDQGFPYDTAELLISSLDRAKLSKTIDKAISYGNPKIPHPTQEEFRKRTRVQTALGTSSSKTMAKRGVVTFMLYWTNENLYIAFSPESTKDVQLINYTNAIRLPRDTASEIIATRVLAELESRKEQ